MKYLLFILCSLNFVVQSVQYDEHVVRLLANDLVEDINKYCSKDLSDYFQKQRDIRQVQMLANKFEQCANKLCNSDKSSCMQSLKRDINAFEKKLDVYKRGSNINLQMYHFLYTLILQMNGHFSFEMRYFADDLIEAIRSCNPRNMGDVNQQQKDINEIYALVNFFEHCQSKACFFKKDSCMKLLRREINNFEQRIDDFNYNSRIDEKMRDFIYRFKAQIF